MGNIVDTENDTFHVALFIQHRIGIDFENAARNSIFGMLDMLGRHCPHHRTPLTRSIRVVAASVAQFSGLVVSLAVRLGREDGRDIFPDDLIIR